MIRREVMDWLVSGLSSLGYTFPVLYYKTPYSEFHRLCDDMDSVNATRARRAEEARAHVR